MPKYKMSEIAVEITERENFPAKSSYKKFVGLEHYDSGEVRISKFGDTSKLESTMKVFQEGDVLIARRNVYLKRAGVVNFSGLTSGDSIVLRPKNDIFGKILPFILNTEEFWHFAEQYSDGTMSKRLSPKILMEYEFVLPEEKELETLCDTLWAAYETKESYYELLKNTDELVKSQFMEQFGAPGTDPFGWGITTLGECCEINPRRPKDINTDVDYSFVAMPSVSEDGRIDTSIERPYSEICKGFTYFAEDDVLFAKITPCMENGKGGVAKGLKNGVGFGSTEFHVLRPIKGISDPYWLYVITIFQKFRSDAEKVMTGTGGQRRVPITYLSEYRISLPPIELQEQFAAFVRQSDKSKFELKKAIEKINVLIKSLMQKDYNN